MVKSVQLSGKQLVFLASRPESGTEDSVLNRLMVKLATKEGSLKDTVDSEKEEVENDLL